MDTVYIWGTGVILSRILDYWIDISRVEAFIDNDANKTEYLNKKVIRPYDIPPQFNAIIVANTHTMEIKKQCEELGIDLSRVVFLYNNIATNDINANYELAKKYLGDKYVDIIQNRYHLVRDISKDEVDGESHKLLYSTPMYKSDYIRVKTLALVCEEIKERNIDGAVAELGVFKGDFSCCINSEFPDRKMYLFDTFEGFGEKEASNELNNGTVFESFIEAFKNTNIEMVMNKMPFPNNIEIRKGLFPDTTEGINDQFAFVSLDVDFEESTYEGLSYFYPRLVDGGYIFVHDYNYGYFDVIKKAVDRFEKTKGIHLHKVPIPDAVGTLIITK